MARARSMALLFSAAAMLATGCSAPQVSDELPRFRTGPVERTDRTLAACDFVPGVVGDRADERWFEVVEGDGVGALIVERTQRDGREIERTEERGGERFERMLLEQSEDGEIWLRIVERPRDDARSVFLTPLRFALRDHPSEGVCRGSAEMEVRSVRNDEVRARGRAKREVRIVGECEVERYGVRETAVVAEMRFDLVLDIARAEVRVELFVVPGSGIVAERRVERRILFGIPLGRTVETVVLTDAPPASAGSVAPAE